MASDNHSGDMRLAIYQLAIEKMQGDNYNLDIPVVPKDDVGCLGQALSELARSLERRSHEQKRLEAITASINAGLMLEDILENLYRDFREIIPYNRIGLALLEDKGQKVRAVWGKSDQSVIKIDRGYSAALAGSSLEKIINTGQPRIINDLLVYLKNKPQSESTHRIVSEGIRSSLTCPLLANGAPVGFLFFSSIHPNAYSSEHVALFKRIAGNLSVSLEKGRLVSELASSKAAIEFQNEELRRLNEMKNKFLGVAAHDLRSPLSQIQLASSLLLHPETWLSEQERNSLLQSFLSSIEQHTRNMLDLLNNLLDVSQIESGHLNLKFETVQMKALLEETAAFHTPLAANKGIRVILEQVSEGKLVADPARLRQVLDQLISNSVHNSPPNSDIHLSGKQLSSYWLIAIKGEGMSFDDEETKTLLRSSPVPSTVRSSEGSPVGLSMAIVKRVIEAHGGEIGVESEPGKGINFWFKLPY
jgi:signal transduction histidine kinase